MNFWRTTKTEENCFDILNSNNEFYVYDLETTGLSSKTDKIIEIAIRKYIKDENSNELIEVQNWDYYINPGFLISDEIENLTGITNEFLIDEPTEDIVLNELLTIIPSNAILVGYNINHFDNKFLQELYSRNNQTLKFKASIDVLEMARDIFEKGKDIENHKLKTICNYYGIDTSFHLAINDTYGTAEVFKNLIKEYDKRREYRKELENQPKKKTLVISCNRWEKRFGKIFMSRIYVSTEDGDCYFDCLSQQWHDKVKNGDFLDRIDMNTLQKDVLEYTNCSDLNDLCEWGK